MEVYKVTENRDRIMIRDEQGEERELIVEALFDMEDDSYALLKDDYDTILMKIEQEGSEQYLVPIEDPKLEIPSLMLMKLL